MQREFPPASFGMVLGLSTAIGTFAGALGPGLIGLIRAATGDYAAALLVCMALKLVGGAFVLMRGNVNHITLVPQNSSRMRGFHQGLAAKRPSHRRQSNPAHGSTECLLPPSQFLPAVAQFLPPDRAAGRSPR